jgi:hypothetical protein
VAIVRAIITRWRERNDAAGERSNGGITLAALMSKKTKKRKARLRRSKANHGKRPNTGRG